MYPGLCDKYGEAKMFAIAYALPPAINTTIQFSEAAKPEYIFISGIAVTAVGAVSALLAAASHLPSHFALKNKGIGITRGGKYTKAAQAITYAIPVGLALTFAHAHSKPQESKLKETPQIIHVVLDNEIN